jgi:uncharacterized membrane protein HdeD (DUF308 family)
MPALLANIRRNVKEFIPKLGCASLFPDDVILTGAAFQSERRACPDPQPAQPFLLQTICLGALRFNLEYPYSAIQRRPSMAQNTPLEVVRHASTASIALGVLLIVLGVLAVASPFLAAVAVNAIIAWLIVFAGVVHLALAFRVHSAGSVIWKLLVGVAYVCFGIYLILHPTIAVAALTIVLASLFLVEGILELVLYANMRHMHGSSWFLFDGIVSLLLGLLIYMQWPSSAAWAIGTLVGISLIFSGVSRVMVSVAVRRASGAVSDRLAA